jgi:hypothetical protein
MKGSGCRVFSFCGLVLIDFVIGFVCVVFPDISQRV